MFSVAVEEGVRTREGRNHRRPVNDQGYFGSVPFSFSMERVLAFLHVTRLNDDVGGICTSVWVEESGGEFDCHEPVNSSTLVNACVGLKCSNTSNCNSNVTIGPATFTPILV